MQDAQNANGSVRLGIPPRMSLGGRRPKEIFKLQAPREAGDGFVLKTLTAAKGDWGGEKKVSEIAARIAKVPGGTEGVAKLTAKLEATGLDRNERLLLSIDGVYATLVEEAIKKDKIRPDDTAALFGAVRRKLQADGGPREVVVTKLLEAALQKRGVHLASDLKKKVVKDLREREIPARAQLAEAAIFEVVDGWLTYGTIRTAVDNYVESRGEIEPDRFDGKVRAEMVRFLAQLGVNFNNADGEFDLGRLKAGKYDEYFALAYQHARTQRGGETKDPIDAVRQKGVVADWNFQIDPFDSTEEQGVVPENILAAGALDYIYNLGERLGIFRLADMVVVKWGSGAIDLDPGESSAKLYRYWKLRSERTSPEERAMLYSRVLSYGEAPMLEGMVANQAFPALWGNLMSAVTDYIARVEEKKTEESSVSRQRVFQATKQLQYNLTEFATGMAQMQINEMYHHLKEARGVLEDPQIVDYFGAGRRKTIWTVIERGSKEWFQESPNIAAIRDAALQGNKVFQWIAQFDQATVTDQEFLELKDAAESWILAQGAIGPASSSPAPEEEADKSPEDAAKDEFDADWDK